MKISKYEVSVTKWRELVKAVRNAECYEVVKFQGRYKTYYDENNERFCRLAFEGHYTSDDDYQFVVDVGQDFWNAVAKLIRRYHIQRVEEA